MKILITAGPTREMIDPVRFISNHSTGEMGYRIAEAAQEAGHSVTLLSGPTYLEAPLGVKRLAFESVTELSRLLKGHFPKSDCLIMAAAVSDYTPEASSKGKIKRAGELVLRLKPTPDLLKVAARSRRETQRVVGFCLETRALEAACRKKLVGKDLDLIVGNLAGASRNPFGPGRTSVLMMTRAGKKTWLKDKTKKEVAKALIRQVEALYKA